MTNLTIAFAIATVPVFVLGSAAVKLIMKSAGETADETTCAVMSIMLCVMPWWALYFFIRSLGA